tara:strand:- start:329 stop:775 length:447 start_codon:yes stop_codon:yes gene_type:complete
MKLISIIFILQLGLVKSIKLINIFTQYGFDRTSSKMMVNYINKNGYEFIEDDYKLMLQINDDNIIKCYEFKKYFKIYSNIDEFYEDSYNPLLKINSFAFDLFNIQKKKINWHKYPSIGFDDEETYKLSIIYILNKITPDYSLACHTNS